ncbi:Rieske (2Fe-2S) protein [Arthrobacter sp. NPDC080031]|uniref:Rieske (2Fe-2S) protein n=1 Tax=Arthrobacter sp. NPDC080031 TaxID=3155918 RepID=UPI0034501FD2
MSTTPERKSTLVAKVEEFPPGAMRLVKVGKQGVGVYNVEGRYHALSNYCPHRGAPLCLGEVEGSVKTNGDQYQLEWERDGEFLRCPWHGWEFDIETGQARARTEFKARRWNIFVEDDSIYLEGA